MVEEGVVPEEADEHGALIHCPILGCDKRFPAPEDEAQMAALEPFLAEHTESHTAREFMDTIAHLQGMIIDLREANAQLQGAFNHSVRMMQQAGIVPVTGNADPVGSPASGLILPPGVGEDLLVARERQHGDVVPGRGTLVGKKITDPQVLKDLKKGDKRGRG